MNKSKRILIISAIAVFLLVISVIIVSGKDIFPDKKHTVGLILTSTKDDNGWNSMHYQGVLSACNQLGAKLIVKENISEGTGDCGKAIEELIDDGAEMIILSSYSYPLEAKEIIDSHPTISFYGISSEYTSDNMTSYFGRMYQARYLSGIVAGMTTETNEIGYVAAMPNNEVNRGINAFTLGVKSVNPNAKVYVCWTNSWDDAEKEKEAVNKILSETNTDILTYHQNQHNVAEIADSMGICSIGYNKAIEGLSEKYLTAAVWNWESLYYQIIREFMLGKANSVDHHWYGITDSEVIGLSEYSPLVSSETKTVVENAKAKFAYGNYIFSGKIYDNEGNIKCEEGEMISDDVLLARMDWYVDGVVVLE